MTYVKEVKVIKLKKGSQYYHKTLKDFDKIDLSQGSSSRFIENTFSLSVDKNAKWPSTEKYKIEQTWELMEDLIVAVIDRDDTASVSENIAQARSEGYKNFYVPETSKTNFPEEICIHSINLLKKISPKTKNRLKKLRKCLRKLSQ